MIDFIANLCKNHKYKQLSISIGPYGYLELFIKSVFIAQGFDQEHFNVMETRFTAAKALHECSLGVYSLWAQFVILRNTWYDTWPWCLSLVRRTAPFDTQGSFSRITTPLVRKIQFTITINLSEFRRKLGLWWPPWKLKNFKTDLFCYQYSTSLYCWNIADIAGKTKQSINQLINQSINLASGIPTWILIHSII